MAGDALAHPLPAALRKFWDALHRESHVDRLLCSSSCTAYCMPRVARTEAEAATRVSVTAPDGKLEAHHCRPRPPSSLAGPTTSSLGQFQREPILRNSVIC